MEIRGIAIKQLALLLILAGSVLVILGLVWYYGSKYFPTGTLPGDIAVDQGKFKFYFPLATSILMSLILSLIFWLWYMAKR